MPCILVAGRASRGASAAAMEASGAAAAESQDADAKGVLKMYDEPLTDKIIIMDDVSQGVVPIDTDRRAWREDVGRTMLWLAKEADEVHRVFCGLGQRIK